MQEHLVHEVIFTEELYQTQLKIINGIHFTDREIDIIACIIGGRVPKKIASFLLISHKTVEVHIRNIMMKLGCNSRDSIIDFIEKANQFYLIRKHYANLLIKVIFEKELKKIAELTENINCIIFHYKSQRTKDPFIHQLEKHLSIVKINTISKTWEKNKSIPFLLKCAKNQQINCVIYSISHEFVTQLQQVNGNIIVEAFNVKSLLKENLVPIVFLLLYENTPLDIKNNLTDFACINFNEQDNYYLLVFELLKTLLPNTNIEQNIAEFKKQYVTLNIGLQLPKQTYDNKLLADKTTSLEQTKSTLRKTILSVLLICLMIAIFVVTKNFLSLKFKHQHKTLVSIDTLVKNNANKYHKNYINKKIFLNFPQRNINFTGRKQALKQIEKQLNKQQMGVITQTISGSGGVGKTQLATEFAYKAIEEKKYSAIFWIPAETTNTISAAYKIIAYYLQLNVKGLELNNIQTVVHNKLVNIYQNSKILFIFDNVPEYSNINDYLTKIHKELFPSLTPYVLITSRSQYWPESMPLILDIFTKNEALTFVKKYLPSENESSIYNLIKIMHFFPLALRQAVAYIQSHTNIDDYLELYATKQKDYLDKFTGDKNQYNESLWKSWHITLNKLSDNAKELLFISAYLASDEIPFAFFKHLNIEERTSAIEELRRYSFISLTNNNKSFKIHRLLQEVIRLSINYNKKIYYKKNKQHELFKTNNYWLAKAIDLLKIKFDFDYLQPEKWKYWSKYLSQAQAIVTHAIAASRDNLQQGLKLYIKYAMFLTYIQYDGKHAIEAWTEILPLIQQHYRSQASQFITASINIHLSNAKNWSRQLQESKELLNNAVLLIYQQPLPIIQQEERELFDLLRIISFKNNTSDQIRNKCDLNFALIILGNAQYKLGLMKEALISYHKGLDFFKVEKLDSISQYYKIYTLWILTRVYIDSGRYIETEKIFEQTKIGEKLYASHPRQAHAYANRALLMYHLGKFQESAQLLDKCSKIRLTNFSPQHIRHADTEINLGFTNLMLGKIIIAQQNFMRAKKIHKFYYDNNKSNSVFINLGLWKTNEALGKYTKASNYMKKTLKIAKLRYKNNINSKMSFQLTQAEIWPTSPRVIALTYWQLALQINQQLFGSNHYQTARYHYMLGIAFEHEHKLQDARKHYRQALTILDGQEIRHPNLKQFYIKNTNLIKNRLLVINKTN